MPLPGGGVAPPVLDGFSAGLFDVAAAPPGALPTSTNGTVTAWQVPIVMVGFSDAPLTYSAATFESALFDTTGANPFGSLTEYYQWASGGRMRVKGRVVAVVNLPFDRHYYASGSYGLAFTSTPNNSYGMIVDALSLCHTSVDWAPFDRDRDGYVDMLWVLHAGEGSETSQQRDDIWSFTSRLSAGWRNGGAFVTSQIVPGSTTLRFRIDRFSTVPELSGFHPGARAEIGVFCHEFGHALGLPDLYDTSTLGGASNVGPGNWSLMSTGGYGGNSTTPESPTHPGGWCSLFLGWRQTLRPERDTTLTLAPLGDGGDLVELWFQGESSPEHFLLESRARSGFDRNVQYEGLIVTHLDDAAIGQRISTNRVNAGGSPGLWVVEADGDSDMVVGRNRGDAYDPFPGLGGRFAWNDATRPSTRTFEGAVTQVALENILWTGAASRFDARVQAPGWQSESAVTGTEFAPAERASSGPELARDAAGRLRFVKSEFVGGRPQIVLRERVGSTWLPPVVLSSSRTAALDPAVTSLPGGDVAVVWSDVVGGRGHIRYRARVAGTWLAETGVESLAGDNLSPSIGADDDGRIHLVWLNLQSDLPSVYFMRFLYLSPFGQPIRASQPTDFPGNPTVAVASALGRSHVVWSDRSTPLPRLFFARFSPDSGLSARLPLTLPPTGAQSSFATTFDAANTFHAVWTATTSSQVELHYERRPLSGPIATPDTLIEFVTGSAQDFSLVAGADGDLHLSYLALRGAHPQAYYKRRVAGRGWDLLSTEVTPDSDDDISRPALAVESAGNVTTLYSRASSGGTRLAQRERKLDPPSLTAVAEPPAPARSALAIGPNPLRPGDVLLARSARAGARWLDVFDLAGRRLASTPFDANGRARLERAEVERLPAGVLFARERHAGSEAVRLVVLH